MKIESVRDGKDNDNTPTLIRMKVLNVEVNRTLSYRPRSKEVRNNRCLPLKTSLSYRKHTSHNGPTLPY